VSVVVGKLVILVSPDGETDWKPVKPEDVPEWLKKPEVLGAMVEGNMAHKTDEPESPWYVAIQMPEKSAILASPTPNLVHKPEALAPYMGPILVESGGIPIPDAPQ
jgi:hypothetical protein